MTIAMLGGVLVPFGPPYDTQGEYYSQVVALKLKRLAYIPVIFHHAKSSLGTVEIGRIDFADCRRDGRGLHVKARIDLSTGAGRWIYTEAKAGRLYWSSAAPPHLVVRDGPQILEWPVCEATLTPHPAAGQRTKVTVIAR